MGYGDPGRAFSGTSYGAGTGMYDDALFGEAAHQVQSFMAVEVTLRKPSGTDAGIPVGGKSKIATFQDILVDAYVYEITPEDTHKSGGFYQMGDIILAIEPDVPGTEEIEGSTAETDTEGYRFVFRSLEYRIVGRPVFSPVSFTAVVAQFHCRKVGNAL